MSLLDAFSYRGKRVLVVGVATGMGFDTAQLAGVDAATSMITDAGYLSADITGTFPAGTDMATMVLDG